MIFEGRTGEWVHWVNDLEDERMVIGKNWGCDLRVKKGVRRIFYRQNFSPIVNFSLIISPNWATILWPSLILKRGNVIMGQMAALVFPVSTKFVMCSWFSVMSLAVVTGWVNCGFKGRYWWLAVLWWIQHCRFLPLIFLCKYWEGIHK